MKITFDGSTYKTSSVSHIEIIELYLNLKFNNEYDDFVKLMNKESSKTTLKNLFRKNKIDSIFNDEK